MNYSVTSVINHASVPLVCLASSLRVLITVSLQQVSIWFTSWPSC